MYKTIKSMRQALAEARAYRDPVNEDKGFSSQQIKMAYGVLNDPRYKQGNYSGAFKAIEKIARGLASHPDVANALKRANEELDNDDKETIKPIIKQLQKSVKAHDKQAKQLQKDIQDEKDLEESTVELSKLLLKKGEGEKGKGPGLTPAEEKRLAELEQDALNKFKNEELDETFTKRDFKDNERDNEHGLNATKVVGMFGTGAEKMKIDAINARHNMRGSISREDQRTRDDIVNKYYSRLK
jgi:hypothetical protein